MIEDAFGNLAFVEAETHVPFEIARVFFVYAVPGDAVRGGHAHRELEQALFCVSGELEIVVSDGRGRRRVRLDDPRRGIYLPPMVWHDLRRFAPGTVYLVLTSAPFSEDDYIRDYGDYLAARGEVEAPVQSTRGTAPVRHSAAEPRRRSFLSTTIASIIPNRTPARSIRRHFDQSPGSP